MLYDAQTTTSTKRCMDLDLTLLIIQSKQCLLVSFRVGVQGKRLACFPEKGTYGSTVAQLQTMIWTATYIPIAIESIQTCLWRCSSWASSGMNMG